MRQRVPYNADRGLGTRCSESTEATQRYASPGAGSQPSIRSRVTPSYRQASHLCHEARIDEAQYQHARTDHADRTTVRPSRRRPAEVHPANNSSHAWDEDQPHSDIRSGASSWFATRYDKWVLFVEKGTIDVARSGFGHASPPTVIVGARLFGRWLGAIWGGL